MKTFMKKWKWKILILVSLCFIYGNSLTPAAISSKDMAGIVTGIMVTAGFMKMTGALKTGRKAAKGKGSGNRSRNNEL